MTAASPETQSAAKNSKFAWWCFIALAGMAIPFYLFLGRKQWFSFDEWDFIAGRNAGHLGDLLRPHTDAHWSTLPILAWRAIWQVAGLRYWPYQTLSVLLHVTIAALLRVVMRRSGVAPWTATIMASLFLFLGAGAYDIIYAFQANFDAAVLFGLTQLLLADHGGPIDRRDALALVAGLAALMCSAPAVVFVAVVGVATLVRRGLKPAALQTLPLAVVFGAWWLHYSRSGTHFDWSASNTGNFVVNGTRQALGAFAHIPAGGWLIAAVLVVGAIALFAGRSARSRRTDLAAPLAMLLGVPMLFLLTSFGRISFVVASTDANHYLHVGAALALPAVAVSVDAIGRRRRTATPVLLVLLIAGVPGSIAKAVDFAHAAGKWGVTKDTILSIGRMPEARQAPRSLPPDPSFAPEVTVGWILDGVASGRIRARDPGSTVAATNRLRLSLRETSRAVGRPCAELKKPVVRHLARGDTVGIHGGSVLVRAAPQGAPLGRPVLYGRSFLSPALDHTIESVVDSLTVRIEPGAHVPRQAVSIC